MRRPSSPQPRRSQDNRSVSPQPTPTLRRSSSDVAHPGKRLLAKLKNASNSNTSPTNSAGSSTASPKPHLSSPSHSRTGSNPALSPTGVSSAGTSGFALQKANSPSKGSREMHRLGPIPPQVALPAGIAAAAAAASASSLSLASTATITNNVTSPGSSTTDPWHMLHVHVLPLFNGEALRMPIESLNQLVQKHISTVVSRSVSRAISTLEQDLNAFLAAGMVTINVKLSELEDEKLLSRVVEIWEFFWHQVLPYVEGIFHPLQTDKLIRTLSRTPKTLRPTSPTLTEEAPLTTSIQCIDVRTLALRSFRDSIILSTFPRIHALLSSPRKEKDKISSDVTFNEPRFQQMLLVLHSTAQRPKSLAEHPPPSQGDGAVTQLLRDIRNPQDLASTQPFRVNRPSSFFAGSAPRDRRGRVARKSARYTALTLSTASQFREGDDEYQDDETPRNPGFRDDRDSGTVLGSLRSPELDTESGGVDGSAGGWGLGRGQEHRGEEDEEDEEPLDWDQAQNVVERMIGLR